VGVMPVLSVVEGKGRPRLVERGWSFFVSLSGAVALRGRWWSGVIIAWAGGKGKGDENGEWRGERREARCGPPLFRVEVVQLTFSLFTLHSSFPVILYGSRTASSHSTNVSRLTPSSLSLVATSSYAGRALTSACIGLRSSSSRPAASTPTILPWSK
jgi:hypothetical protein